MAAYLEENQLKKGKWYWCETYDGGKDAYRYEGDMKWVDSKGKQCDEGFIRYALHRTMSRVIRK